jgi:hypothetical protein
MSELADRIEIAGLFARLARLLDEGRPEDIADVYAEDVEVTSPRGSLRGIAEVMAFLRRPREEGERTQHLNGDVLVDLDGDSARASAYQLVHYFRAGQPPHRRSGLRVVYIAIRTPAGWRFREGRLMLMWADG